MKIIINADDFGLTKSVNRAIFELAELGSLTSTTVMVGMPYAQEAKKLIKYNKISIGLHFTLTQGKPVSKPERIQSLVNAEGKFLGKSGFLKKLSRGKVKQSEIYTELEAQYNKLFRLVGDRLDHMDSHQGLNKLRIVSNTLLQFGKTKRIKAIRVYSKYYIKKGNGKYKVKIPDLLSFREFGVKRVLVELFLKYRVGLMNKHFFHPDGLLLSPSHNAIDVFKALIICQPADLPQDKIVEVPFHPAADLSGLTDTKLKKERVTEYEFLKAEKNRLALSMHKLVNYTGTFK